jgi:ABC-type phosphate/phosphonate transport system permease subunit
MTLTSEISAAAPVGTLREYGWRRWRRPGATLAVVAAVIAWSAWRCGVSLGSLSQGLAKGVEVLGFFYPPEWASLPELVVPACLTILLAAVAAPLGVALSLVFGLAGARNLAPTWLRLPARVIIGVERALPALLGHAIFRFEVNLRASVLLGAVGVGGIGFELNKAMSLLEYERAMMAVLVTLALVFGAERFSDILRRKVLDGGRLK